MSPLPLSPLPPLRLPDAVTPELEPVTLRPLTLADNAAAFVLAETAFPDQVETSAAREERQERWARDIRPWFGWLHAQPQTRAVAAVTHASGHLVGYARAVRDTERRYEHLSELFVLPQFQGGRVGKALLAAVLAPEVESGWQRVIFAQSTPAALALYHRWGTYPIGEAWYVTPQLPENWAWNPEVTLKRDGVTIRHADLTQDAVAITTLDDAYSPRRRLAQLQFSAAVAQATILVAERGGAIVGYGVRQGGTIGPVLGAEPMVTLALVEALLADMRAAGQPLDGLWLPGGNTVMFDWLRRAPVRYVVRGQVTIMAAQPECRRALERSVLTAPAYLV